MRAMEKIHRLIHDIYVFIDAQDHWVFGEFDLTCTQYRALMLLDVAEGISLTTLAHKLIRNRSTATRLVAQLEQRGLVQRLSDATDARVHHIVLTLAGDELRSQARRAHLEVLESTLGDFVPEELEYLKCLLGKLRGRLIDSLDVLSETS